MSCVTYVDDIAGKCLYFLTRVSDVNWTVVAV